MKKLLFTAILVPIIFGCGLFVLQMLTPNYKLLDEVFERVPGELIRYTLLRLEGHSKLEAIANPTLLALQRYFEQPIPFPMAEAQKLGKGQQAMPLPIQRYTSQGHPIPSDAAEVHLGLSPLKLHKVLAHEWLVDSESTLVTAMNQAKAGDTITIVPGKHYIGTMLHTMNAGKQNAPIIVRADIPGTTHVYFTYGRFHVDKPYWIFENLHLKGECKHNDGPCEHAFQIVGSAKNIVIRNNHLHNFFSHIKVNADNGISPDGGLVQFNTLSNDDNYGQKSPLTPFDLVVASHWNVADNLVHHFVKAWSQHASYGIFMKGGGHHGVIERNLVVCTADGNISHNGSRVGISLGGGLTGAEFCPDKHCIYEHADGIIANNIIVHCNDFGIDNNRSLRSTIAHNTLINTYGIDIRNIPSSADIYGNYYRGAIIASRGGEFNANNNSSSLGKLILSSDSNNNPLTIMSSQTIPTHQLIRYDFCGRIRNIQSLAGATTSKSPCQQPL